MNHNNNLASIALNRRDKLLTDPSPRSYFRENSNETRGGAMPEIRCHPGLPATPLRVVRLISLRIYACVADEKEIIHAQASEIER